MAISESIKRYVFFSVVISVELALLDVAHDEIDKDDNGRTAKRVRNRSYKSEREKSRRREAV